MSEPYRVVSANPVGTSVSRYICVKALGRGDRFTELAIAETMLDCPQVKATLQLHTKASVAAGSTTDATWAGPLSAYGIAAEALTIMRGQSILGALEGKFQRAPLHTRIARETGAGFSGGWVGAGAAIPVQLTAFATVTEEHFKFGVITILSQELMKLSTPDAEATIRRAVLGGLSAALDNQLLDPTVAVAAGVNPASILNGASETTTTGTTAAQIAADLAAMLADVVTPGPLVWVMRPGTMYRIALVLGQAAGLPHTLFGVPVIASVNSPAQIALLDPSAILYSDSGQFDIDVSEQAAFQFDSAPAEPTAASTVFQSLYQRNLIAIKALRWLAWLNPSPTTSAAFMTVAY